MEHFQSRFLGNGHKLESSLTRVFVWSSTLMKRLQFACFADFFVSIIKNQSRLWFSLKSASRRDTGAFVKLMSKNSISGCRERQESRKHTIALKSFSKELVQKVAPQMSPLASIITIFSMPQKRCCYITADTETRKHHNTSFHHRAVQDLYICCFKTNSIFCRTRYRIHRNVAAPLLNISKTHSLTNQKGYVQAKAVKVQNKHFLNWI